MADLSFYGENVGFTGLVTGAAGAAATPVSAANPLPTTGGTGAAADQVQGNVASGVADSGNPVKAGAKYVAAPGALTDGWRTDLITDNVANLRVKINGNVLAGSDAFSNNLAFIPGGAAGTDARPMAAAGFVFNGTSLDQQRGDTNGTVMQPALSSTFWQYAAGADGIVSSTADVVLKAAGAAGVRNFLASLTIQHDALSAVTEFVVKDGAAIIYRGKLQTAANETGLTIQFPVPLRGTAATALNFALLTPVTGGVFVNGQGYTGA